MKSKRTMVAVLLMCALVASGLVGCNTFRGAGKDIQRGGQAVGNAADNVQESRHH